MVLTENKTIWQKTSPFTINLTWNGLGISTGLHSKKQTTNSLSHGRAVMVIDYKYSVLTQKTTIKIFAETTDTIISFNQDINPPELLINTASYFDMKFI